MSVETVRFARGEYTLSSLRHSTVRASLFEVPLLDQEFAGKAGRNFLAAWARANIGKDAAITYLPRHLYEKRSHEHRQKLFSNNARDGTELYLPYDIKRGEMRYVVDEMFQIGSDRLIYNMGKEPEANLARRARWKTLAETLDLEEMKITLAEARKKGVAALSAEELKAAGKIQEEISKFPYKPSVFAPSDVLEFQKLNCAGASLLGGRLLGALKIQHLEAAIAGNDKPAGHVLTPIVTSDKKVYFRDMRRPQRNGRLLDTDIRGKTKNGKAMIIQDIVAYANNPNDEGLLVTLNKEAFEKYYPGQAGLMPLLFISSPVHTYKMRLLYNMGIKLHNDENYAEALVAYQEALRLAKNNPATHWRLGLTYQALCDPEAAEKHFAQASRLALNNPNYPLLQ